MHFHFFHFISRRFAALSRRLPCQQLPCRFSLGSIQSCYSGILAAYATRLGEHRRLMPRRYFRGAISDFATPRRMAPGDAERLLLARKDISEQSLRASTAHDSITA